jgi:hypothetical protein
VADSLSSRVADLNERAARYKWRRLIENFFGKLKEFKPIALIRDESQQALGEKALCADLRPYTARSINDRYLRV